LILLSTKNIFPSFNSTKPSETYSPRVSPYTERKSESLWCTSAPTRCRYGQKFPYVAVGLASSADYLTKIFAALLGNCLY
jgi:hypothetical protein